MPGRGWRGFDDEELNRHDAREAERSAAEGEAFALALFLRGQIIHAQFAQAPGLDRLETDALLKRREVPSPLTHEEVDEDVRIRQSILGCELGVRLLA